MNMMIFKIVSLLGLLTGLVSAQAYCSTSISWDIEEGENFSFFHRSDDFKTIAPDKIDQDLSESSYEQYVRILSDPTSAREYRNQLGKIAKSDATEWNDRSNQYKSTYKTICHTQIQNDGFPRQNTAFCQRIKLKILEPPEGECQWIVDGKDNGQIVAYQPCKDTLYVNVPIDKKIDVSAGVVARGLFPKILNLSTTFTVDGKVILALGDSYVSGEGNPDQPALHKAEYDEIPKSDSGYNWFLSRPDGKDFKESPDEGPIWLDRTCHRSLLSNQFKVALRYAVDHPKQRIVFASFSCSGAEILQGLLQPQNNLPYPDRLLLEGQIQSAVRFLCNDEIDKYTNGKYHFDKYQCRDKKKFRQPDLILLSIGGNDVGFGPLVSYTMTPVLRHGIAPQYLDIVKWVEKKRGAYKSPDQAASAIEDNLKELYEVLRNELIATNLMDKDKDQSNVLQSNYPNTLGGCTGRWDPKDNLTARSAQFLFDVEHPFDWLISPSLIVYNFLTNEPISNKLENNIDVSMTAEEAEEVERMVIKPLQTKVEDNKNFGWKISALTQKEQIDHGVCTLDKYWGGILSADETFKFPYREENDQNGKPQWRNNYRPSQWIADAPQKQRWFNTVDDAVLKLSTRLCPSTWQLFGPEECTEMLRGSMHPNLAYHAKIADIMYDEAKKILEKKLK